jgi:hypothetical protein
VMSLAFGTLCHACACKCEQSSGMEPDFAGVAGCINLLDVMLQCICAAELQLRLMSVSVLGNTWHDHHLTSPRYVSLQYQPVTLLSRVVILSPRLRDCHGA